MIRQLQQLLGSPGQACLQAARELLALSLNSHSTRCTSEKRPSIYSFNAMSASFKLVQDDDDDDERGYKLAYSLAEEHAFGRGVKVSMMLLEQLLGSFSLPMQVAVDVKDESGTQSRQVVWLKEKSSTVGVLYIHEPLLSKIRSFSHEARHWSLIEIGYDGVPCLALKLRREKKNVASHATSSKYIGVNLNRGKWLTRISANGKVFHLGRYSTEEEAARIYDSAAHYLKGAQAKLNFPDEQPRHLSDELKARIDATPYPGGCKRAREEEGEDEDSVVCAPAYNHTCIQLSMTTAKELWESQLSSQ